MNIVLVQEITRFNILINVIKESLVDLQKAISGKLIMSNSLEDVFNSMIIGKVPILWVEKSYPSLKSLGNYVSDLCARIHFFQKWIDNGPPTVYWLSGFFFIQSFLTGILQNYSRKIQIPIDLIELDFEFTNKEPENILSKPVNYINSRIHLLLDL